MLSSDINLVLIWVQFEWVGQTQPKPNLIFGQIWTNIFNTRIELGLIFFQPKLNVVGLEPRFRQFEPNLYSI